jgi:hypothetical protein
MTIRTTLVVVHINPLLLEGVFLNPWLKPEGRGGLWNSQELFLGRLFVFQAMTPFRVRRADTTLRISGRVTRLRHQN